LATEPMRRMTSKPVVEIRHRLFSLAEVAGRLF
jgi:hypothetical protein